MSLPDADQLYVAHIRGSSLNRSALRALLKAYKLLGFAFGMKLVVLRAETEPLQAALAQLEEARLERRFLQTALELLASRIAKLPERRRPYYTPEQRATILQVKAFLALSAQETARLFVLSTNTVARWTAAVREADDEEPLHPRIRPEPPVRRIADVVRNLVRTLDRLGVAGNRKIAQLLARAGWKLSHETVRRIRKEKPDATKPPAKTGRRVAPRYPNHIWFADLTVVPSFFRLFHFHIAAIFDGFSRLPLAVRLFWRKPTARQLASLLWMACQRFGAPRHLVTDHGDTFTAEDFRKAAQKFQIRHRFGAVAKSGSVALIERFWRTLKELARLRWPPPLTLDDLARRVEPALVYYAFFRPHDALDGATPAEVYFGKTPLHLEALSPPRGQAGEGPRDPPFRIGFLDAERRFPILLRKAA